MNRFNSFPALNTCFLYYWLLHLSSYEINNKPEIETDVRTIEANLQSQSQVFDCIIKELKQSEYINML